MDLWKISGGLVKIFRRNLIIIEIDFFPLCVSIDIFLEIVLISIVTSIPIAVVNL